MNTCHHYCACTALLFIVLLSGCHGLSGVRYHDGPSVDDPSCVGCGLADAGTDVLAGEMDGAPPVDAPHPRFHPLPTRPVFESEVLEPAARPTRAVLASTTGSSALQPASHSVLAKASDAPIRLASTEFEDAPPKPDAVKFDGTPSSRRKPDVQFESSESGSEEQAAPSPPADSEPAKKTTPPAASSNDMWRPRAGSK